jgi:hypothetical protein
MNSQVSSGVIWLAKHYRALYNSPHCAKSCPPPSFDMVSPNLAFKFICLLLNLAVPTFLQMAVILDRNYLPLLHLYMKVTRNGWRNSISRQWTSDATASFLRLNQKWFGRPIHASGLRSHNQGGSMIKKLPIFFQWNQPAKVIGDMSILGNMMSFQCHFCWLSLLDTSLSSPRRPTSLANPVSWCLLKVKCMPDDTTTLDNYLYYIFILFKLASLPQNYPLRQLFFIWNA